MSVRPSSTWAPLPPAARYAPDQTPTGRRRELLERVPRGAEVLDVGCWSGATGRFLADIRAATIDGVEPDPAMAEQAARTYRHVHRATIEDALATLSADRQRYDTLLFLDVLEHLVDPHAVLVASRALLRPGGTALVSLPNVAHWSLRAGLLRGDWTYREHGLLDRTHLRFFTQSTAAELVQEAGWSVRWRSAAVGDPPLVRLAPERRRHLERWPSLFAVQFLLEIAV